jgi:hypothetical protein
MLKINIDSFISSPFLLIISITHTHARTAYALERLGRTDEALDLCREVQSHKPTDETVLSTLVLIYKQTGQTREATQCYEGILFMYIYVCVCVCV